MLLSLYGKKKLWFLAHKLENHHTLHQQLNGEPQVFQFTIICISQEILGTLSKHFWNLIEKAILCDVAVERQVEITGPDAYKFTQLLTT